MAWVKLKLILNSNDELKQKMFLKLFGNTLISLYFNSNNLLKKLIKNYSFSFSLSFSFSC